MNIVVKKLDIKKDERGWLTEIVQQKDVGAKDFGVVLITTALPGQIKGNHYHKRKTEWYCVVKGKGLLTLVDLHAKDKKEIEIGEENMILVKIPPLTFHRLTNIGNDELLLLTYVDEPFDESNPDTFL